MYEYLPSREIERLGAHDDPDVRHLAQDLRQYAAELLLVRFHTYGERFFQEPEPPELPRLLWKALQDGPQQLTEDEVEELERLAHIADGWWTIGDRGALELVQLDQWEEDYAAYERE